MDESTNDDNEEKVSKQWNKYFLPSFWLLK